jgi:uncharacterized RDD family membrane protein YckC
MAGMSMEGASQAEENASVWRRFMALAYESVILFAVVFFFGYAFSALTQSRFNGPYTMAVMAFQIWMALVLGGYFVWFWSNGRRTLPMKTMGIKLVGPNGADISASRATARYVAAGVMYALVFAAAQYINKGFAICLFIPFFWSLIDKQSRALYDVMTSTRMVLSDPR